MNLHIRPACALLLCGVAYALTGCRSPLDHRHAADRAAERHLARAQQQALGQVEPLTIEPAAETLRRRLLLDEDLPYGSPASLGVDDLPASRFWQPEQPLSAAAPAAGGGPVAREPAIGLMDALRIGALNSPDFQEAKETVYEAALDLDLEADAFRSTFAGMLSGEYTADGGGDETVESAVGSGALELTRVFRNGIELTSRIMVDVVKLLTQDAASSLGLIADAGISIPLLRGSGRLIVGEPLRQAERNLLYAVYGFERFKRTFAVQVAADYLAVLQAGQEIRNSEENYKRLVAAARRARRLADAGRLPEFQYDQAVQDELRARARWIDVRQRYASNLDAFKVRLGLPPDAALKLDPATLDALRRTVEAGLAETSPAEQPGSVPPAGAPIVLPAPDAAGSGPLEMEPRRAIGLALASRLDLRTAESRVEDAQRAVYVAADALRAELTLLGSARIGERRNSAGSATEPDAELDPGSGVFSGLIDIDLPLERTAERNAYRKRLIDLHAAVRKVQQTEDAVKLSVLDALRRLRQARENLRIQMEAARLAAKRAHSTDLLLQAGRAEIRDVLEAEEALLNAQNAVTAALVSYRINELALQRDMGVLRVGVDGLWTEYAPEEREDDTSDG